MFSKTELVKIKKLAHRPSAISPAGDWSNFKPGTDDNGDVSLPVEYEIKGYIQVMELGFSMQVNRIERNGVSMLGNFATSPLRVISPGVVVTDNSVYTIESVEPG